MVKIEGDDDDDTPFRSKVPSTWENMIPGVEVDRMEVDLTVGETK